MRRKDLVVAIGLIIITVLCFGSIDGFNKVSSLSFMLNGERSITAYSEREKAEENVVVCTTTNLTADYEIEMQLKNTNQQDFIRAYADCTDKYYEDVLITCSTSVEQGKNGTYTLKVNVPIEEDLKEDGIIHVECVIDTDSETYSGTYYICFNIVSL